MGILEEVDAAQGQIFRADVSGRTIMIRVAVFMSLLAVMANVTFAQTPPPPVPALAVPVNAPMASAVAAPRDWQSLSPPQQHLLQNYRDKWNTLPAERQQALAKGSQRWLTMTPAQRAGAQQRFNQWRAMPPEQRLLLRQRWQQFKSLPTEQQQQVRESFQRFRQMPPERRSELRRQWRQMSPEQRRNFVRRATPMPRPRGR